MLVLANNIHGLRLLKFKRHQCYLINDREKERVERILSRTLVKSAYQKNNFLISQTKTYVVGTQKNSLNETVLLSTQNIC